jgi:hypothetical protein
MKPNAKTKTMRTKRQYLLAGLFLAFTLTAGIFTSVTALNNERAKDIGRVITYAVKIDPSNSFTGSGHFYRIILTDGTGLQVAPSQDFQPGVWTYTFFEAGDVRGTRVARMIIEPLGPGSNSIAPCSRTGLFLGGQTYEFIIAPNPKALSAGNQKD